MDEAVFSVLRYRLFYFNRVQFITSFNQSVAFIVPVFVTLIQLKYQGNELNNTTPFSTHPRSMILAISSSTVYCLANIALLQFPLHRRFAAVAHHCLALSAYASVASLASVLFPDSFSPYVYSFFGLLSAAQMIYLLRHKLQIAVERAELWVQRRALFWFLNIVIRMIPGQWRWILPQ